jgi:hypothetical protein
MRALPTIILVLAASTGAALAGPVALSEAQADRVTAGLFPSFAPAFFLDASLQQPPPADGTVAGGSGSDGGGGAAAEVSIVPGGPAVAESSVRDGVAQAFSRRVVVTSR